ncbi:MAG: hypothetical protein DRG78_05975 [Epsilonproteobacteria bacterium]|nr:MAG: hypothetical protein DRG78_05975 [Campylobacterota bacterium]
MFNSEINIQGIGPIGKANFELGDITVFVGQNNTGKTFLLNSIFFFQSGIFKNILNELIDNNVLADNNNISKIKLINENINIIFTKIKELDILQYIYSSNKYTEMKTSSFSFNVPVFTTKDIPTIIDRIINESIMTKYLFDRMRNIEIIELFQKGEKEKESIPDEEKEINFLFNSLGHNEAIKSILRSFIYSYFNINNNETEQSIYHFPVERAGMNKFFYESLASINSLNIALKSTVEFIVRLNNDTQSNKLNQTSFYEIAIEMEDKLFGGHIVSESNKDSQAEILFKDNNKRKYTVDIFSSSINELSLFILYLKYYAKPGDVVLFDEPELSLHPDSQRNLVKFIARIREMGIKFIIITHSDYIVKEINHLISLSLIKDEVLNTITDYSKKMKLNFDLVKMYSIYKKGTTIAIDKARQSKSLDGYEEKLFTDAINSVNITSSKIFNGIEKSKINDNVETKELLDLDSLSSKYVVK